MTTRRRKTPTGGALVLTGIRGATGGLDSALAQLDALAAQAPARAAKPRRKRSGPTPEGRIKAAILDALALRSRDCVVWKQNAGAAMLPGRGGKLRPVRFQSVLGCADIVGLIRPWGVHLEIEVKVPGRKQEDTQVEHEARVRAAGGVYFVARSPEEALARLDTAIVDLVALGYPPRGAMLLR